MAALFGRAENTVLKWVGRGMPGENGNYPLQAVIQWREQYWEQRLAEASGDPMLVDESDSPALERYRLAQAKLREMDIEERSRNLIDREAAVVGFMQAAALIRASHERLQLEFGPDAHAIVEEAMDAAIKLVSEQFQGG